MLESIDHQLDPFLDRYLDPAGRLGEILFGLIMALGISGAVRLGLEEADSRKLLIGILGCNLAWAIVDGVMYVLTAFFERGRKLRLARDVRAARSDAAALQLIAGEYAAVRRWRPEPIQVRRDDFLGGVAVALVILVATVPIVVPYLLVSNATSQCASRTGSR